MGFGYLSLLAPLVVKRIWHKGSNGNVRYSLHFHTVLRIKIHINNPNYIIYWYMFTSSCFKSILLVFEDHAASHIFIDRKQKMFFIWMLWITIFMFKLKICSHYLLFVLEKLARVGVVLPPEGDTQTFLYTLSQLITLPAQSWSVKWIFP